MINTKKRTKKVIDTVKKYMIQRKKQRGNKHRGKNKMINTEKNKVINTEKAR